FDLLHAGRHHALELHCPGGQGHAASRFPEPAEKEARHLPQRIESQAARHHRIADEMAGEEPEIRLDFELRADESLVELAAGLADLGDAVEHQHWRRGQLGVAGAEQLAAGARQQVLVVKARFPFRHMMQPRAPERYPGLTITCGNAVETVWLAAAA